MRRVHLALAALALALGVLAALLDRGTAPARSEPVASSIPSRVAPAPAVEPPSPPSVPAPAPPPRRKPQPSAAPDSTPPAGGAPRPRFAGGCMEL